MTLPPDPTLDEIRGHLAPRLAAQAVFDGWTPAAIESAAAADGIDPGIARLAFPAGAVDMIDAWFDAIDAAMAVRVPPTLLASMKVRERITALVTARIEQLAPDREALRRALAVLAMPQNAMRGARLGWRAADRIWRLAGDTATDYNHYTKRLTLAAVYGATILAMIDDDSPDLADSRAFLARRIDGIMAFEIAKAKFVARADHRPSLSRFIGRLRYPAV